MDKKIPTYHSPHEALGSFEVKLPLFEGPFDLLLFFIERDELDIHDIPIAHITEHFFLYISAMEHLNIPLASEFICVASRLMKIKARMLLPSPSVDTDDAMTDPREGLVAQLLEYKQYKSLAASLGARAEARALLHERGNLKADIARHIKADPKTLLPHNVSGYDLLRAYARLLQHYAYRQQSHRVALFPYTVGAQKKWICTRLKEKKRMSFMELIGVRRERLFVVFNLLAILDLCQGGQLRIDVSPDYRKFWVALAASQKKQAM